ncbi:MAG: M20/M25/M40 family metallo-hydrolase [Candidatus Anstonellales archaeon]
MNHTDESAREFLYSLVNTQSFSGHEQAAANLCKERMIELGYSYVKIDSAGNVIGANYDYNKYPYPDILLFSHLDTVSGFWEARKSREGISGRGVVDAKGCLASILEAGIHSPSDVKVVVAGVVEEEAPTSKGIRHLLSYLQPKMALNGEPSGCSGVIIAYKGRIVINCRADGEEAHAGISTENPIEKMVSYYQNLRPHFPKKNTFDSVVFNVTHIDYGRVDKLNVIPGYLDFYMDVRVPPTKNPEEIIALFRSLAPKGIKINIKEKLFGCEINQSHPLVRKLVLAIRSTNLTPKYIKKLGSADMNITMAEGIPTVAYGPGDARLDHTNKEFLSWKDYDTAIAVLKNFLSNLTSSH